MKQLTVLEDFIVELDRRVETVASTGKSIMHFAAAKATVNALLPRELFVHAVYSFDESGQAVPPDGSAQNPIFFAINRDQPGSVQVSSFLSSVLSTLHRQSILEAVQTGREELAPGFPAMIEESDRSAGEEAERLLRASQSAGHVGPIAERLLNFGWGLRFNYRTAVRGDLEDIRAAMRFFGHAYNKLEFVRDAIDKVAYTIAGAGWRVGGEGSEEVRAFLEARLNSMNLKQIIAQLTRDSQLLGTGCMVFIRPPNVSVRLIKPTKIRIEGWNSGSGEGEILDEQTGRSWRLSEVMLDRGVQQEGSPYGLSVLEPAMPNIHTILSMERVVERSRDLKRKIQESNASTPTVEEVQSDIDVADETRSAAEENLKRLFWFPETALRLDRSELYLPGHERWVP